MKIATSRQSGKSHAAALARQDADLKFIDAGAAAEVPAVLRENSLIALAHANARAAAVELAWLRHAGKNVDGRQLALAKALECLRAAYAIVEEEFKEVSTSEPLRVARI